MKVPIFYAPKITGCPSKRESPFHEKSSIRPPVKGWFGFSRKAGDEKRNGTSPIVLVLAHMHSTRFATKQS